MIKALILDIDGVLVGDKKGINTPDPHPEVIAKLRNVVHNRKIPVILSTAKPHFAVKNIIKKAQLNNPHITDGGAVLIDPLNNSIIKKFVIPRQISAELLSLFIDKNIYVEFYTTDDYFIQSSQRSSKTDKHTFILQKEPKFVESLLKEANNQDITKIMPILNDESEKEFAESLFVMFRNKLTLNWTIHPVALPLRFGVITALNVSKKLGAIKVMENLHISFEHALGVGDSKSDWNFIQLCGYKATMGNADKELKVLVNETPNSFIGPSVDENGIIVIINHFLSI